MIPTPQRQQIANNDNGIIEDCGPRHERLKRKRISVQFSSSVRLRSFFYDADLIHQQGSQDNTPMSSWVDRNEVASKKNRTKTLSKLHYLLRAKSANVIRASSSSPTSPTAAITPAASVTDVTRYEIYGESLRGMEHITDVANGWKRRRVKEDAIQAAIAKVDSSKLANVYGSKAQEALLYAKRVAQEDANIAAAILAEDLQVESASPSSCISCTSSSVECSTIKRNMKNTATAVVHSTDPRFTAEIIKSFLSEALPMGRRVTL